MTPRLPPPPSPATTLGAPLFRIAAFPRTCNRAIRPPPYPTHLPLRMVSAL